jgi:hypothetical protein
VCIYTKAASDMIADVNGYVSEAATSPGGLSDAPADDPAATRPPSGMTQVANPASRPTAFD